MGSRAFSFEPPLVGRLGSDFLEDTMGCCFVIFLDDFVALACDASLVIRAMSGLSADCFAKFRGSPSGPVDRIKSAKSFIESLRC